MSFQTSGENRRVIRDIESIPDLACKIKKLEKVVDIADQITGFSLDPVTNILTITTLDSDGNVNTYSSDLNSLSGMIPDIVVDTYTDLTAITGQRLFEFAQVRNDEGTRWLPGSLGGTYRGAGLYYWDGTQWVHDDDKVYEALQQLTVSIGNVQTNLTQEIADRIAADALKLDRGTYTGTAEDLDNADAALQTQITSNDNDITVLQGQVTAIQNDQIVQDNALAAETANRIAGDTALQGQITSNDSDISQLQTDLGQEITDRTNGDNALQTQITSNDTDITALQNDKANSADLGATAFSNDYNDLDNLPTIPPVAPVDSVNGQTGVVVLDADDIDDTTTTNKFATQAELDQIATNQTDIAQEVTDRTNADTALQTQITNNDTDITDLQNNKQDVKEYFQSTPAVDQNNIVNTDTLLVTSENKNSNNTVFDLQGGVNLVINKTGDFKFTIKTLGQSATGARERLDIRLQRDIGAGFVDIPLGEGATQASSYHRNIPAGRDTANIEVILSVVSGNTFRVVLISPTSGVNLLAIGTNIIVEEK